jgi:hypothetical protein
MTVLKNNICEGKCCFCTHAVLNNDEMMMTMMLVVVVLCEKVERRFRVTK